MAHRRMYSESAAKSRLLVEGIARPAPSRQTRQLPVAGFVLSPRTGRGGLSRIALSLLLLFLQEIISYRHRLRRRNPRVQAARRRKEQRVTMRQAGVNFLFMVKNANDVGARLREANLCSLLFRSQHYPNNTRFAICQTPNSILPD